MRKSNKKRKSLFSLLIVLLFSIGIGYAALTSNLALNGTAIIDNATWNIHFDNIVEVDGSVTPDDGATIDTPTSISFEVSLNQPGDYYDFFVDVVNEGSIDAMIESVNFTLGGNEISSTNPLPTYLEYSVTYDDWAPLGENHLLQAQNQETYRVHVKFRTDINPEDLPDDDESLELTVEIIYVQDDGGDPRPRLATLAATSDTDTTMFRSTTYKPNIKTITLEDELNPPSDYIESWDAGDVKNGDVMAYIMTNQDDNTKYDLLIQGNGHLSANPDSSWWFYDFDGVDEITGLDILDTSRVTNMREMFAGLGSNSTTFTLDLGNNFDTSHVIDMYDMFYATGYNSTVFTLDLGESFDTSNVENMAWMFDRTGYKSTVFEIDLGDKFDTSKVKTMEGMFYYSGYSNTAYTLDLGEYFDTSLVTSMECMFYYTGSYSTAFTLSLGEHFNTSSVITMKSMFRGTGWMAKNFTLDLGNHFDTHNVTNMEGMFCSCATSSKIFTLDLGDFFDTSKVTTMKLMFMDTGQSSNVFTLDLGDHFDTSKVTDMYCMFDQTGWKSPIFTLDLGENFDTSNVTNMYGMFASLAPKSEVFTLDLGDKFDTSKVTNMCQMFSGNIGSSSPYFTLDLGEYFDTSNVTNMDRMFESVGYRPDFSTTQFTLNLGDKFDTSKVTNMNRMFLFAGNYNPNFTLDLGDLFDTSRVTNMSYMFGGVGNSNPNFELDVSQFTFQQVSSFDGMFGKGGQNWGDNGPFIASQKIYVKNSADVEWIVTNVGADAYRQNEFLTRDNVLVKP